MRLILIALISGVAILTSFRKPKIGLFFFLCLLLLREGYFMEQVPQIYIDWHLPMVIGWSLLVAWLFYTINNRQKIIFPVEMVLLVGLGAMILISKSNASVPYATEYVFGEYIRVITLVFLIINIVRTEGDIRQIALVLISIMTFLVLYAYYRYKTESFDVAVPSMYYVDRNGFAESIVAAFPLVYIFFESAKTTLRKYFPVLVMAILGGGVILTYSRGGLLALMIVIALLLVRSKQKVSTLVIVILVVAVFAPHIGTKYTNRMETAAEYQEDDSSMIRIATWKSGINMVKAHPLIGIGAGNFNDQFLSYVPEEMQKYANYTMSIHNIFLQVFSETGLIGGGIFILILMRSFFGLHRLNRDNKRLSTGKCQNLVIPNMIGISLVGICGAGFFLPGAYHGYQYIIIALLVASRNVYSERIANLIKSEV